ncbi:MAG TPA: uroporphyrinogen decarboxylase [Candidatus Polarisedimenticolia bacterium]|jgi:uroporphyrinogen decarboxylase|nr:uroporphyrinogen decarboxylase [Candidatus Polarisedimenticolia bacterium]
MSGTTQDVKGFDGLRVGAFESRLAAEMSRLIESHGGRPLVAPSMREIPLEENHEALAFGEKLLAGEFDLLILLTGVGLKTLVQALEVRHPRDRILESLGRMQRVCRGPKPVAALRSMGLEPGITVPEPNTWLEILKTLDERAPVAGRRVAVQEYGISNLELLQGLKERGAVVTRVPVYRWALPLDVAPLREALEAVAGGQVPVVLFTNANQVENVMQVARDGGLDERVRAALARGVVASVGPIASESLRNHGIPVDLEPSHPKMGPLVREASLRCHDILKEKTRGPAPGGPGGGGSTGRATGPSRGPGGAGGARSAAAAVPARGAAQAGREKDALRDSPFMRACRREPVRVTPIWLMRQAGRYMREYRQVRAHRSFLEICKDPDLVTQVTVYAVERLRVDAAIIFADLLLPVLGTGLRLAYNKGEGPSIDPPLRTPEDVDRLREPDPEESVGFVFEAIRRTRRALPPEVPLLGFAGAPFTMASYMIEGGGSTHYVKTKSFFMKDPGAWHALLEKISRITIGYLGAQIAAGAQAVQLFDTWVGCLGPADYREFVLPHTRRIVQAIAPRTPVIHFGTQTASLLPLIREAGGDVIGLDWRVDLLECWDRLGEIAVQGNLDPTLLFAPRQEVQRRATDLLRRVGGRPGHIFNLGHGILPHTPLDNVLALVDAVHEWGGA